MLRMMSTPAEEMSGHDHDTVGRDRYTDHPMR